MRRTILEDLDDSDVLTPLRETLALIHEALAGTGYCLVDGLSEPTFRTCLVGLGEIIDVTNVTVRPGSRALVTSAKALSPHTDHHKADFVAWYCHSQCDEGGETVLVDGVAAYETLEPDDRGSLEGVLLKEHKVFPDDPESHPLVERLGGRVELYYSYWLLRDDLDPPRAGALERFRRALGRAPQLRRRLEPGEALIVANRWMFHGRTAIRGSSPRLLRRYWIAARRTG